MIFTSLIIGFLFIIKALIYPLPQFPSFPIDFTDSINTLISMFINAVSFSAYIISGPILLFILVGSLVIINFDLLYSAIFWIIRKIPVANISE